MSTTKDYGWTTSIPESSNYLVPAVLDLLKKSPPQSILDIGCGNGSLLRSLEGTCRYRVGCDADAGGIAHARAADPTAHYIHTPIGQEEILLPGSPYDAIVSTEVIEHLYCPDELFILAKKHASRSTHFIVSTPYHGWLKNVAIALTGHWDVHHTALWNGGHVKFWSPTTLAKLAERNGWRQVGFVGVGRVPWLWKSMILMFMLAE